MTASEFYGCGGGGACQDGSCGGSAAAPASGSAAGSASLDPRNEGDLETNQQPLPSDPYVLDRNRPLELTSPIGAAVFGDALAERRRILSALREAPNRPWANRVVRMEGCCNVPAVGLTDAGAVGAVWFRCRDRLCPLCARIRSRQVAERVTAACSKADSVRFLTLTIKSQDAPLAEQLDALYDALRRLRRTADWKAHVVGGVGTVEVTRNARTGQWHPHLHLLVDGKYWHQPGIVRVWKEVTGDSSIVHIKAVRSKRQVAEYIAKYSAKPTDMSHWPVEAVQDYAAAIHRRRMLLTFGTLHNIAVEGDDEHELQRITTDRIPLGQVERRSRIGCRSAQLVLAALAKQSLAYARSLRNRVEGYRPVLAPPERLADENPAAAHRQLATLWENHRTTFESHVVPPVPPPPPPEPPGRRINARSTPPLDDSWLQGETRKL